MLGLVLASMGAFAEDMTYSFSMKNWNHTYKVSGASGGESNQNNAQIMTVTGKYKDYFLAANFLLPSTYNFNATYLVRRDTDIAAGYSLNRNISILAGVKSIASYTKNPDSANDYKLTYLGVNAFGSVGEQSYLYGTFTYSPKVEDSAAAANAATVKFTNYEAGYGYALNKQTQLSVGYRSQVFDDGSSGGNTTLNGLIFGVTITP